MHELTPDLSRRAAINLLAGKLADAGLDNPQLDARLLACAALAIDHAALVRDPDAKMGAASANLATYGRRRLGGEPVSRILGHAEFWGLRLEITPDVLDPRADSETLVRAALGQLAHRQAQHLRILDLGTGSGALLCALLSEFAEATGLGVDSSEAACAVARRNLATHHFDSRALVAHGHWGNAADGTFDLIVSNPPYIESSAIALLAREVRQNDPFVALDGGVDGLVCYRAIMAQIPGLLAREGVGVIELGQGQADAVAGIAHANALHVVDFYADFGGIARALLVRHAIKSDHQP